MGTEIKFNDKNFITQFMSYVFIASFIIVAFSLHLMIAVVSGLTVFLLISKLYNFFNLKIKTKWAHKITLLIVVFISLLVVSGLVTGLYFAIKIGNGNVKGLEQETFNILQQVKAYLPPSLVGYIPDDVLILKEKLLEMAHQSGPSIFEITGHSAKAFVHSIIGMLLGAIVAFSFLHKSHTEHSYNKPFVLAIKQRITIFAGVFERVIFSQAKISAINTALTAMYILVILPLSGSNLPYGKTLVMLTFFVGLIPVLGNLITNTIIVLISLTISFKVALASLVFLIIVHKLEYYINAKIVGTQIKTSIWEMLIAMVIMEAIFGLFGVALAPIFYGYIKAELSSKNII